jgi:hypothetical protein
MASHVLEVQPVQPVHVSDGIRRLRQFDAPLMARGHRK